MYKLSEIQHNYSKKQIFVIINQEITRMTKKSQVIYKTRYSRKILQNSHQKKSEKQSSKQDTNCINIRLCYSD